MPAPPIAREKKRSLGQKRANTSGRGRPDADEGINRVRRAPAEPAPHRFASLYPTPITVSMYLGFPGSDSIFLRRFFTCTSMVRS